MQKAALAAGFFFVTSRRFCPSRPAGTFLCIRSEELRQSGEVNTMKLAATPVVAGEKTFLQVGRKGKVVLLRRRRMQLEREGRKGGHCDRH